MLKKYRDHFIVFIVSFIFRFLYVLQMLKNDPSFYHPIMDMLYHHEWASLVASGQLILFHPFFRAPFYPYFLGFLYFLTNHNLFLVRIIQIIIGSVSCVLIYLLAFDIFKNKKVALLSGLIGAFYPMLIYYDAELLIPVVLIFWILLGIYLLRKAENNRVNWFWVGLVWGMAVITRPNVLLFIFAFILWKFIKKRLVLWKFILGLIIPIIPVALHNYIVSKEFILIAWQGGLNFYLGNNEYADGCSAVSPILPRDWWHGYNQAILIAERTLGKKLSYSQVDRFWFSQAVNFILKKPLKALYLFLKKTILWFFGLEIPNNRHIYFYAKFSYLKFFLWHIPLLYFPFGLLLPFAFAGIYFSLKNKNIKVSEILLFMIFYSISFILFFVNARYRMPLIPFYIIFASFSIYKIFVEKVWKKDRKFLLIFVSAYILSNVNYFGLDYDKFLVDTYVGIAGIYDVKGDRDKEFYWLRKAEEVDPYLPELHLLKAKILKDMRRYNEAKKELEYVIKVKPNLPDAYLQMGIIYVKTGRIDSAEIYFRKAILIEPIYAEALVNLGNVMVIKKKYDKAIEYYKSALRYKPFHKTAWFNLGYVYYLKGDREKAKSIWLKLLKAYPDYKIVKMALRKLIGVEVK